VPRHDDLPALERPADLVHARDQGIEDLLDRHKGIDRLLDEAPVRPEALHDSGST
jgi:hypothetical protein